ncbi:MAG: DNA-binding protein [Chloroflexi bacterium]|nr:DNA-binding protein [Chloroflexota bacterium]MCL5026773.1 DNA-binding protein [Chloroflexota bacterium]
MRIGKFQVKNIYFITVETGEDLLATMQKSVDQVGIKQGVVLCGIGVQEDANLYEVISKDYPAAKHYEKLEGVVELVAIQGNVVEGAIHMHAVVSTDKGVWAGHVEPGNKSLITLQVMLAEIEGDRIVRKPNPSGGPIIIDFER